MKRKRNYDWRISVKMDAESWHMVISDLGRLLQYFQRLNDATRSAKLKGWIKHFADYVGDSKGMIVVEGRDNNFVAVCKMLGANLMRSYLPLQAAVFREMYPPEKQPTGKVDRQTMENVREAMAEMDAEGI